MYTGLAIRQNGALFFTNVLIFDDYIACVKPYVCEDRGVSGAQPPLFSKFSFFFHFEIRLYFMCQINIKSTYAQRDTALLFTGACHMGRSGSLPLWGVWNCPRKWSTQPQAELVD